MTYAWTSDFSPAGPVRQARHLGCHVAQGPSRGCQPAPPPVLAQAVGSVYPTCVCVWCVYSLSVGGHGWTLGESQMLKTLCFCLCDLLSREHFGTPICPPTCVRLLLDTQHRMCGFLSLSLSSASLPYLKSPQLESAGRAGRGRLETPGSADVAAGVPVGAQLPLPPPHPRDLSPFPLEVFC